MVISPEVTKEKFNVAVRYIVKRIAEETTSGTYYVHDDDFPADVLEPELFTEHIRTVAEMMRDYDSVAEADLGDGTISVVMYLGYCPSYEPTPEEVTSGEYPNDRMILDPLTKGGRSDLR